MPLQVPVFQRELMNKMYSPSPYLFGRMLSHIMLQLFSPILLAVIIFFGIGLNTTDYFDTFLHFIDICIEINLIGCTLGYVCGVAFNNEEVAR